MAGLGVLGAPGDIRRCVGGDHLCLVSEPPQKQHNYSCPLQHQALSLALHMVSLVVTVMPPALRALSSYLMHREGGAQKSRSLVRAGLRSREKNWNPGLLAPPPVAGPRALFPLWVEPLLHDC